MFDILDRSVLGRGVTIYGRQYFQAVAASIDNAFSRVWIASYVLNGNQRRASDPILSLFRALSSLAFRRGGDVRFLLHYPARRSTARHANLVFGRWLLDQGFSVRRQLGRGSLHAKMILIDDTHLFIGSHNLVRSSLENPLELSVCIYDSDVIAQFAQVYSDYFSRCPLFPGGPR